MKLFDSMEEHDYEQLVFCQDKASRLKAIVCIHDTTLGPALGGTRMWPYETEEAAVIDVLRLSRGMTYKNAAAGLNFGGGKTVIIGDPLKDKSEALLRALGRFIESLNGRYITGEDVGICVEDLEFIKLETSHVKGTGAFDPSPFTGYGVWQGMKACAAEIWGQDDLTGKTVAIQGLGHVGYCLAKHLHESGAKLIVADINEANVRRAVQEMQAQAVRPEEIYGVECDIFSPCALGGIINDSTIPQFKCKVVAGSANNQLDTICHGDLLRDRGILYAPDFIINAGGVVGGTQDSQEQAFKALTIIYKNLREIFAIAKKDNIPTYQAADTLAEQRIALLGKVRSTFIAQKSPHFI